MVGKSSISEQPLGDGLLLRSARSSADIERLMAFNASIHGPGLAALTHALMVEHPQARLDYWLFIEDVATQRVAASLCLLPWTLRYGVVQLRAAEMGIVGTAEDFRRRGLVKALNKRFNEVLLRDSFDLSIIQGIPYFYRQFGYEYAMPLELWCRVELHQFRALAENERTFSVRRASDADLPQLERLYNEAALSLDIATVRDTATWRYLLGAGLTTETGGETLLVIAANGHAVGYVRVMAHGFGDGLICGEASLMPAEAALAVLAWLCDLARERGKLYLRLNLPPGHVLNMLALHHGAHDGGGYAWQIKVPDAAALLHKLAPLFAQRLQASAFAGWQGTLAVNLYQETLALHFEAGLLTQLEALLPGTWGDLRLPPQLLAPLALGWRSLAELKYAFPDVNGAAMAWSLANVLFPPQRAFLYGIYGWPDPLYGKDARKDPGCGAEAV
ncbi:GNAT family N-acetyltransferase [Candidatus Gracilibacteria bacterium]|nr:GNAT family N-acetyltransferase [Candidatus Gracilibacteria bacterium]